MATAYVRLSPLPPWIQRALDVRRLNEGPSVSGVHGWFEDECLTRLHELFPRGPRGEVRVLRCHLFKSHCEAELYLLVEMADLAAARVFASWVAPNAGLLLFDGPAALGGPVSAFADEYVAPLVVEVLYRVPGNPEPPKRFKSCGCRIEESGAGARATGDAAAAADTREQRERAAAAAAADGAGRGGAAGSSGDGDGDAAWAVDGSPLCDGEAAAGASRGGGGGGGGSSHHSPHGGRHGDERHRSPPNARGDHHHVSPGSSRRDHRRSSVGGSAERDRDRGRGGDRGAHHHHHNHQRHGPPGGSFSQPWGWPPQLQQQQQQQQQPQPTSPRIELPPELQRKVFDAKRIADVHEPQWVYYDAKKGGQSEMRTQHELLADFERGRVALESNVTNEDEGRTVPFSHLLDQLSTAANAHYAQQGPGGGGFGGGQEFSFW